MQSKTTGGGHSLSPRSPLQEPHEEEQAPRQCQTSHPAELRAGLGPFGKTSQGAAGIAAGTVRPWHRDPSGAGTVPGDGGTSLSAPILTPGGRRHPQSSARAQPPSYATNYSARINDFAAEGEMT